MGEKAGWDKVYKKAKDGAPDALKAVWGGYSFVDSSGAYLAELDLSNSFGVW
jgi:hypothetical protein